MDIIFYYNSSPNNQLIKDLSGPIATLQGTLRNTSNIVHPEILVATNITTCNYVYIPEFNRYYYIKDVKSVRNDLWLIFLDSDPLMSFYQQILNIDLVLAETENTGIDNYLADSRVWIPKVKDKTSIIPFPNGLLQDGEFILITAGG